MICQVYRSRRKADVYLYVEMQQGMERVPPKLLAELGDIDQAMTLVLKPGRRLARITAEELMRAIAQSGYYLQLPVLPNHAAAAENAPRC